MKRKFVCGIALCLALAVAGCGKSSEEQQAANYYQNELGLDKEDAEELAHELYGDDDEDEDVAVAEPEETVVAPLPELLNSEWYEQKVQIYDMIFSNDWYMTEEDVRRIVEGSAYNFELTETFDSDGNICLEFLTLDRINAAYISKSNRGRDNYNEHNEMVEYGLIEAGDYYAIDGSGHIYLDDNWYDKESTEFADLGTRDDVLAYLAGNGFVEVEKEQSTYPSFDKFFSINGFSNVYTEDSPVEFADTPYYYSQGMQSITFYRMHRLSETDQTIEMSRGLYGRYIYSGAHLNLVNCVSFEFGTDGTVTDMKWGILKFIVYED